MCTADVHLLLHSLPKTCDLQIAVQVTCSCINLLHSINNGANLYFLSKDSEKKDGLTVIAISLTVCITVSIQPLHLISPFLTHFLFKF